MQVYCMRKKVLSKVSYATLSLFYVYTEQSINIFGQKLTSPNL